MDEPKKPTEETQVNVAVNPQQPPAAPAVNDVVAPPPQDAAEQKAQADVMAAQEQHIEQEHHEHIQEPHHEHSANSSTLAVVATVIIVIALSLLAVFAYMQTNTSVN